MAVLSPTPTQPRYSWGRLARLVALVYVSVAVYAWFFSEDKIFLPHPVGNIDARPFSTLTTPTGARLSTLWLPNPKARHTLLYSHGNAEDLSDMAPVLAAYRKMGFQVFAYDYEGYGLSSGKPSEQGAYADIEAAYAHLTGPLGVKPDRLLLLGHSLGGGPSAWLAERRPVAGLVLESTFTSAFRVLTHVPVLPFDRFATLDALPRIHVPVLVIHGRQDETIPFEHGPALFAAAHEPKSSLWLDDAGHDDVVEAGGDRYARALQAFAASLGGREKAPHSIE